MHQTDCDLLGLLHGEPVWPGADEARRHLETCLFCAGRLESLRHEEREQRTILKVLDMPVPAVTAATIRGRAVARRRSFRVAASIGALVTLASAAAALPGSPVRGWIRNLLTPSVGASRLPAARPSAGRPATEGIEFTAVGTLVIELRFPQVTGQIRIVRTGSEVAVARAIGGDVGFQVGSGRVILENRRPAERYEFSLPRNLAQASVLVGGRLLVRLRARDSASRADTLTFDLSRHPGRAP